jgi:cytochrome c oxidase subunit III
MTDLIEERFISRRRPEGIETRPMGWWGTVLLAAVLATTYAALYFTYVYLRVSNVDWPPEGIDPPALGLAGLSALALAVSALPVRLSLQAERARALIAYRLVLVAAVALGGVHIALVIADWLRVPFAVDEHAYGSLYFVVPGFHLTLVGIGLAMALVLLLLSWHEEATAMLHIGTRSLTLYWYVTVVGGLGVLAVVYIIPHVWRVAISPAGAGP